MWNNLSCIHRANNGRVSAENEQRIQTGSVVLPYTEFTVCIILEFNRNTVIVVIVQV